MRRGIKKIIKSRRIMKFAKDVCLLRVLAGALNTEMVTVSDRSGQSDRGCKRERCFHEQGNDSGEDRVFHQKPKWDFRPDKRSLIPVQNS
jgi:hypothetical protein